MKFHDTLVLNKHWIPIHVITWKKSMSLIYQESAHALDRDYINYTFKDWLEFSLKNAENYMKVHTPSLAIAVPEIIVLTKYDKLPARDVKYSRENVLHRDKYRCQYCGIKVGDQIKTDIVFQTLHVKDLTIDHVIPRSKGGNSTWPNVVTCCRACNSIKADRTPVQAGMRLIRNPVKPQWLNPVTNARGRTQICVSWRKFMDKIDMEMEKEEL